MEFNNRSRNANALLASASGIIQQLVQILGNFAYRTLFLMILSKEYLGINGVFSNVLQLFSLAELGIGTAILYGMYKPFAERDTEKIGAYVRFYKNVYHAIALVVAVLGLCFYPFIEWMVDVSEVPGDVNLTLVYFLFVLQSVSSYLFVYKQSLLNADQRTHVVALFNSGLLLAGYAVKLIVLLATRKYELVLLSDIATNLLVNGAFSIWISVKYRSIFEVRGTLPKEERHRIYKDTAGLLCHKVGSIVVTGTDNLVLSKMVSLAAVGIYSNYAMIITAITNLAIRVFGGLVPTIANYVINKTPGESYGLFKRMLFANMWVTSFTTVCLYLLLNPFIELWLDESFLLSQTVVALICLQHYLQVTRLTANNFINGCGLFMRDRIRPLVEASVNLVVSVVLAKMMGIAGVFIGTVVSGAITYIWREPWLLSRNVFHKGFGEYWLIQAFWFALTAAMCFAGSALFARIPADFWGFVLKVVIAGVVPNLIILLVTFRTGECRYFLGFVARKLSRFRK